jgi:hypothetical protein
LSVTILLSHRTQDRKSDRASERQNRGQRRNTIRNQTLCIQTLTTTALLVMIYLLHRTLHQKSIRARRIRLDATTDSHSFGVSSALFWRMASSIVHHCTVGKEIG